MLRVTMEIVPYGCEERRRTIGTLEIANISKGFSPWDDSGDYEANLNTDGMQGKSVRFFGWPRRLGCWALLQAILQLIHKPIPIDYQSARYVDLRDERPTNAPERIHPDDGCGSGVTADRPVDDETDSN